ncbi:hypothetical protein PAXRUDRAFT_14391 [Paxillus rubicundulus Ve08.2h10]|uniref:Uncharacterized protein n=1 Tax=Paxillus rubicundulus Ve08.2h10 TaxID=930991 RepID=A0A0D0DVH9_9AGAM|nr:hypothetical protein PAXRUDRAFT_14391 [Paxillus rubicundulus Ve08.2h10]
MSLLVLGSKRHLTSNLIMSSNTNSLTSAVPTLNRSNYIPHLGHLAEEPAPSFTFTTMPSISEESSSSTPAIIIPVDPCRLSHTLGVQHYGPPAFPQTQCAVDLAH